SRTARGAKRDRPTELLRHARLSRFPPKMQRPVEEASIATRKALGGLALPGEAWSERRDLENGVELANQDPSSGREGAPGQLESVARRLRRQPVEDVRQMNVVAIPAPSLERLVHRSHGPD